MASKLTLPSNKRDHEHQLPTGASVNGSRTHFRYKRGQTEIECDGDNNSKGAIRLAKLNSIFYWIVRCAIAGAVMYKFITS
jgi:hypothetical protein